MSMPAAWSRSFFIVTNATSSGTSWDYGPLNAVDGDFDTRWQSAWADDQWLALELEHEQPVAAVEIWWEMAHALKYRVEVCGGPTCADDDESRWQTIARESQPCVYPCSVTTPLPLDGRRVRFVRVVCERRATEYGFSIFEVRVRGTGDHAMSDHALQPPLRYNEPYKDFQQDTTGLSWGTCGAVADDERLAAAEPGARKELIARLHYDDVRERVLRGATERPIHPYFAWRPEELRSAERKTDDRYSLVSARLRAMARHLERYGRDDFLVEKDKCEMHAFFERNGLHALPVLGRWRNWGAMVRALGSGAAAVDHAESSAGGAWPRFLKACHITQGDMRSVRRLPSQGWLRAFWRTGVQPWLGRTWAKRADDANRPWAAASNALTDILSPGFLLEGPASGWAAPGGGHQVLELKVEVLWGHALLAVENSFMLFFARGDGDDAAPLAAPRCVDGKGALHTLSAGSWWQRLYTEGHMRCAWRLAEATAAAAAADTLRVDIFVLPGEPEACALNEISLSSAMNYAEHNRYLAMLWAEPYLRGEYQLMDGALPVHLLTPERRAAAAAAAADRYKAFLP